MTTRTSAPIGAPCWADLWTSDVEGSRKFYAELFGWEAQEPSPEFGGYFMFTRNGVPVAGGMGDMGDMKADNSWKIYLATDDIAKTLEAAEAEGARVVAPVMAVADLGRQAVLIDPTGAVLGAWQPGTFPGFTVLNEHGAPGWFELLTRDYAKAVAFYRSVFGWDTSTVSDTDEFRYTVMRDPVGRGRAGRDHGRQRLPPRGRRLQLVGLLRGRRHRRHRRRRHRPGRFGPYGAPGHSLRPPGRAGRPGGRPVQAAHAPPVGPAGVGAGA